MSTLKLKIMIKEFESYFGEEKDKYGNIITIKSKGAHGIAISFQKKVKMHFGRSVYNFSENEKNKYKLLIESCCLIIQEAMACEQADRLPRQVIKNLIWLEIEKASELNYIPFYSRITHCFTRN